MQPANKHEWHTFRGDETRVIYSGEGISTSSESGVSSLDLIVPMDISRSLSALSTALSIIPMYGSWSHAVVVMLLLRFARLPAAVFSTEPWLAVFFFRALRLAGR